MQRREDAKETAKYHVPVLHQKRRCDRAYLNSLTHADLERTKKYSDIEWSEALNEEAKRMPGFADTLIKKTEIESKAEGKAEKTVEVVRNMQKEGFSPEMIAKIVQKSVATVKSMML